MEGTPIACHDREGCNGRSTLMVNLPTERGDLPVTHVVRLPLGAQKRCRTSDTTFGFGLVQRNDFGAARRPH